MKVAEFVAEILLKGSSQAVKDIRNLSAGIKDMRLGLGAALDEFYKITAAAREMAVSLDAYQVNTGLSTIQLQKLSFQASQAGVSMTELGQAIQKLQQQNATARLGYGWDPVLTRLGLTPGQDPVTQLNQIGSALRRMQATHPGEAYALAMKAGLSDSVYYALIRGTTEQMDEQLILTEKEQNVLVKLNREWNKFWFHLKQIGAKLQALSAVLQTQFIKLLTEASRGFLELVTRANDLITANEDLKYGVIAFGVAVAAVFAPWLITLGLIALALQDIWVYFEGGESVTGKIIKSVQESEKLKKTWEGLVVVFSVVSWVLKHIIKAIQAVSGFLDNNPKLASFLEYIAERFSNPLGSALQDIGTIAEWLRPNVGNGASMTQTNNTTVHLASTGNVGEDIRNVHTIQAELNQSQGQIGVRSIGGVGGWFKYVGQAKLRTSID